MKILDLKGMPTGVRFVPELVPKQEWLDLLDECISNQREMLENFKQQYENKLKSSQDEVIEMFDSLKGVKQKEHFRNTCDAGIRLMYNLEKVITKTKAMSAESPYINKYARKLEIMVSALSAATGMFGVDVQYLTDKVLENGKPHGMRFERRDPKQITIFQSAFTNVVQRVAVFIDQLVVLKTVDFPAKFDYNVLLFFVAQQSTRGLDVGDVLPKELQTWKAFEQCVLYADAPRLLTIGPAIYKTTKALKTKRYPYEAYVQRICDEWDIALKLEGNQT